MKILGIDPGFERLGVAVLEKIQRQGLWKRSGLFFPSVLKLQQNWNFLKDYSQLEKK